MLYLKFAFIVINFKKMQIIKIDLNWTIISKKKLLDSKILRIF